MADDTVDLTLLSGQVQEIGREMRLLRIQMESLAGTVPARLSSLEQSFHNLAAEVSRDLGQIQQQMARLEKQNDVVQTGLTALRNDIRVSMDQILQAVSTRDEPPARPPTSTPPPTPH